MKPLEHFVCNRELAEELKRLGYPQESLFGYVISRNSENEYVIDYSNSCGLCSESYNVNREGWIAAPTCGELGEILPARVTSGKNIDKGYYCKFDSHRKWTEEDSGMDWQYADTEADAKAAMLIFLIKNHYIDVTKI